ncbi:hypothetical protein M885DRAFT_545300 [Pelagophyceae sp. CCMP2097]|nr:hypothetical protein M885DRAFT_545300 [Pelagophyceae sp. CCMP2097]
MALTFKSSTELCYVLTASGVTPTRAHLHFGALGVSGDVVVSFFDTLGSPPTAVVLDQCITVTADVSNAVLADPANYYVNIHSDANPNGAIRGQLGLAQKMNLVLLGANVPDNMGDATATGSVGIFLYADQVCFSLTSSVVPTAMHIHAGVAGASGTVSLTFEVVAADGAALTTGCTAPSDGGLIDMLLNDPASYYVNLHTTLNGDGATRAQLAVPTSMTLTLEGAQVPDGMGSTTGTGSIDLYIYESKVCFTLTTDLDPSAMHIHSGAAGTNGGLAITLGIVDGCVDNTDGTIAAILLNPTLYYVNLHTSDKPNGALRAQIVETDLETASMMVSLEGSQVPDGMGDLTGSGEIDLTYYETKVCFVLTTDLTPSAMHIHAGAAGANGGLQIVLDVASICVASTAALIEAVLVDPTQFYVNLHTAEFGDGAIRGQLDAPARTSVILEGSQVPDAMGSPTGSGSIEVYYYTTKVCFMLTTALTATSMHIHSGAAGANGDVAITLDIMPGCVDSSMEAIDAVLTDPTMYYVNLHTSTYTGGAIRGQIAAPAATVVALEGSQVTMNMGFIGATGSIELSYYNTKVCFLLTTTLTPTALHIHKGLEGANGVVSVFLDVASTCVDADAGTIEEVLYDPTGYYVNLHTVAYPDGAIRGQIASPAAMMLALQGAQVPNGMGDAVGSGTIELNYYGTKLCFLLTTTLDMTSLHIHAGAVGANGDVTVALDGMSGCVDATAALIESILLDPSMYYVNLHTATFADGAVRAQLFSPASMTFMLEGSQVPSSKGSTTGTGSIELSFYMTKICFMLTTSLTATALHIHMGAAGDNGGVAVSLGVEDACVDASDVKMILTDPAMHYVNLHTATFADGALRGQLKAPAAMALTLEGSQVPMGAGSTTGSGSIDLYAYSTVICFMLTTDKVSPTAMHVHLGVAGASGVVVLSLGIVDGCVDVPVGFIDGALAAPASFYVNVHSVEFEGGAVRAQLAAPSSFDVTLEGSNVPDSKGSPAGSGEIMLFLYDQKVCFALTLTNVVATAAHVHAGLMGANGGVTFAFFQVAAGGVSGCVAVTDGSQDLILSDPSAYYVNVHSAAYPDGAVRGQVGVASTPVIMTSNGGSAVSAAMALFAGAFAALIGVL